MEKGELVFEIVTTIHPKLIVKFKFRDTTSSFEEQKITMRFDTYLMFERMTQL